MEQSSFQDEQTVRHQFDSLCKLALKSEVINYEKHMAYRQKYEVMLSELSEKELSRLFIMDEHEMETHRFQVLGYDIEVKDALIAEALQTLTEKKIGEKKIRMLISEHLNSECCFTVQVGCKSLINRKKFEAFLDQTTSL